MNKIHLVAQPNTEPIMNSKQLEIVAEITEEVQKWYAKQPAHKGPISFYCLWWAYYTVKVLEKHGYKPQINAGSASWQTVEDRGDNATHYSYVFEWNAAALAKVQQGALPEIHVWAAITPRDCPEKRGQIIDLTTQFVLERSKTILPDSTIGYGPMWFYLDEMPDSILYAPSMQATEIAYASARSSETGVFAFRMLEKLKG